MASYTQQQIIFSLSALASVPLNDPGKDIEVLQRSAFKQIDDVINDPKVIDLIGEWELVWGPLVYKHSPDSLGIDNMMCVYHNKQSPDQYVVGIAGTNFLSTYGFISEDIKLNPMQLWPYKNGLSSKVKITNGTMTGLNHLMALGTGSQTMMDYFKSTVLANGEGGDAVSITVAGHSLGGTLAPAVALMMSDTRADWDPQSRVDIAVVPSAGLTPGNLEWANYYQSQLGNSTNRLWNAKDVAPHCWQLDDLKKIPTLYEPWLQPSSIVQNLVLLAQINSLRAGNIAQICPDTPPLVNPSQPQESHQKMATSEILKVLAMIDQDSLVTQLNGCETLNKTQLGQLDLMVRVLSDALDARHNGEQILTEAELTEVAHLAFADMDFEWTELSQQLIRFVLFLASAIYEHVFAYFNLVGNWSFVKQVYWPA